MNRTSNLALFPFAAGSFSLRRLPGLLFFVLTLLPLHGAPKGGSTDRESPRKANGPEVCIVERISKTTLTFRILREDDTWSENVFEINVSAADHFVGQFFMVEPAAKGWTLARVFSAAESKNFAALLQKKRPDNTRSKSLRQRLLDDFLTSVRL